MAVFKTMQALIVCDFPRKLSAGVCIRQRMLKGDSDSETA